MKKKLRTSIKKQILIDTCIDSGMYRYVYLLQGSRCEASLSHQFLGRLQKIGSSILCTYGTNTQERQLR